MAELNYSLQARIRQLLGTRGAPLLSSADFLQPAAIIASAEGRDRNPAFELGEGIRRGWVGQAVGSLVALQFSVVQVFAPSTTELVHVKRILVNMDGSVSRLLVGRIAQQGGLSGGLAHWTDNRLPLQDIATSTGVLGIEGGTVAAFPTFLGWLELQPVAFGTMELEVDYPLVNTPAGEAFAVACVTSNTTLRVSIEGEVYGFGPGAR